MRRGIRALPGGRPAPAGAGRDAHAEPCPNLHDASPQFFFMMSSIAPAAAPSPVPMSAPLPAP